MGWILIPVALLALAAALTLYGGREIMHPPPPDIPAAPSGGQPVTFPASDGVTLRGWLFPVPSAKGMVVYGPGRGRGLNGFDFRYIPLFNRNGYSLLLFDARGLGASGGASSMGALEWRDFLGAASYLASLGIDKLAFVGTSQGAAAAVMAAARCPAALATVAECPYASWQSTLHRALRVYAHLPAAAARPFAWLLAGWLQVRLGFRAADADPAQVIGRISPRAVMLIYGPLDPYIPPYEMDRLFAVAGEPKELWVIPEAGHTQGLELRPQEFETRVIAFLDRWLLGAGGQQVGEARSWTSP